MWCVHGLLLSLDGRFNHLKVRGVPYSLDFGAITLRELGPSLYRDIGLKD